MHRITIVGIAALAVAGCSSTPTPAAQAPTPVKTVTVTASPVASTGPASAVVPSPAGNAGSATPKATKALDPRTVVKTKRPTVQVVCGPENDQIRTPEVRGITYDQQMEWSGSEAMVTARAKSGYRIADGYKTRWTFTDKATRCGTPTPTKPTQECRVYDSTGVCRTPEEQAEHEAWINDQVEEADRIAKEHACPDGLYWYEDDQACR
ncbi:MULTISPECIES: hypothetical protein [Arsenicicoccus]|uniref:hypothetical protein n=1 Tax=Arsenicicoccus TaxID=267408 RepID=UPI002579F42B|nr:MULTISPECIES: hypothetical protein [Arsenicicoccus]